MVDRSLVCLAKYRGHVCKLDHHAHPVHHCLCNEQFVARHVFVAHSRIHPNTCATCGQPRTDDLHPIETP